MLTEFQKSLTSIDSFKKGVNLRLRLRWGNVSSYALDHLYSTPHCLRSRKVFPAVGTICVSSTCRRNEVIISRASLDGVESERSVGRNRVRSSLVQTSASPSRVYWLAGEGSPSVCHRYWSGLLARWRRSAFGMLLGLMTKDWHQQVIVTPGLWLDGWRSWRVTRDDQTWRWSRLEWFWNDWGLGTLPWAPDRWSADKSWSKKRTNMKDDEGRGRWWPQKDSTPAASVHAPNVASTAREDLSHITCFNYDQNGHYATKCPKPRKNRDTSED